MYVWLLLVLTAFALLSAAVIALTGGLRRRPADARADTQTILGRARRRFFWSRAVHVLMWSAFSVFAVLAILGAIAAPRTSGLEQLLSTVLAVVSYVLLLFIPFVVAAPIAIPFAIYWHRPPKALLFRPFHDRRVGAGLTALVKRHVAPFCHTYTLADSRVRVRLYVRIPILLGQIALFSFRFRRIRRRRQMTKLRHVVNRTRWRSLNWFMSHSKLFAVASTDDHWEGCAQLLIRKADLILIDLTSLKANVRWEVAQCRKADAVDRVIFLTAVDQADQAEDWLSRHSDPAVREAPLCAWTRRGASRGLDEEIRHRAALPKPYPTKGEAVRNHARLAAVGGLPLLFLAWVAWLGMPSWAPEFTAKWSPFIDPVARVAMREESQKVGVAALRRRFPTSADGALATYLADGSRGALSALLALDPKVALRRLRECARKHRSIARSRPADWATALRFADETPPVPSSLAVAIVNSGNPRAIKALEQAADEIWWDDSRAVERLLGKRK